MQKMLNRRGFLILVGVMLAAFLVLFLMLHNALNTTRQQENALQVSLTRLQETGRQLENDLKLAGTDDYIVSSAKTDYAYMNKNDLRFEFSNPEALYAYTEEELAILMEEMAD